MPRVTTGNDQCPRTRRALVARFVDHRAARRFEKAYRLLNPGGRFVMAGQTPAFGT